MPRETIVLNSWHGGICDDPDRRDIGIHELEVAQNVYVDSYGILKSVGKASSDTSLVMNGDELNELDVSPIMYGYGVFTFSADHDSLGVLGATNYFVHAGNYSSDNGPGVGTTYDGKAVVIQESDGTKWASTANSSMIRLSYSNDIDAPLSFLPVFYYVNGGLRICDGNFADTRTSRRGLYYVKNTLFKDKITNSAMITHDKWYPVDCEVLPPSNAIATDMTAVSNLIRGTCTVGSDIETMVFTGSNHFDNAKIEQEIVGWYYYNADQTTTVQVLSVIGDETLETETMAAGSWDGDEYQLTASSTMAAPVAVGIRPTGVDGNITTGRYEVGVSLIYDGIQESPLTICASSGTDGSSGIVISASESILVSGYYFPHIYNERVTGGRIYIKKIGNDSWNLIGDVSFKEHDGLRSSLTLPYGADWRLSDSTAQNDHIGYSIYSGHSFGDEGFNQIDTIGVDTFEALSGLPPMTTTIEITYKTVAINNNIAYAGNVKRNNIVYEDSIFKSVPGKYDTFPEDRRLDVVVNDGAAIVKLETFADRLIQFKQNHVYIINVAQEVEFLEDEIRWAGINYPYQSIATEYGIAWVNQNGCYLYDGRQVIDLLMDPEHPRRRKISLSDWRSHAGTTPMVGYDARDNKLLSFSGVSGELDIMIFDFRTMAWIKHLDGAGYEQSVFSNVVTDWDGYPIWRDSDQLQVDRYKSTDITYSSDVSIAMKDLDFQDPGIKKNIYSAYITYKGGGIEPYYRINGTTEIGLFTVTGSTSAYGMLPLNSSYVTVKCVPAVTSNAKNINSFQFCLKSATTYVGSTTDIFEVNDVTVIGRKKGYR